MGSWPPPGAVRRTRRAASGLALREQKSGLEARPAAGGPFTIVPAATDGSPYNGVVATQPSNPLQVCTVSGGAGTVAATNGTNIAVNCTTPAPGPSGSLDPAFGDQGRVFADLPGGATAMALQPDGKIVVAGGSKVLRFNADGDVDQGFGSGGVASLTFPDVPAAISNLPQGIVVQSDGAIVVAGFAQSGS
ncbi:MAG: hypothetical protein IRY91_09555, partial [Gemmatimonadaceae bacterium]|nr:hypothetical protein [Gemmatimonadaceae bacterium]